MKLCPLERRIPELLFFIWISGENAGENYFHDSQSIQPPGPYTGSCVDTGEFRRCRLDACVQGVAMCVHGVVAGSDYGLQACKVERVLPRLWEGESGLDEWEGVTAFRGNLFHCRMSDSESCGSVEKQCRWSRNASHAEFQSVQSGSSTSTTRFTSCM